RHALVAFSHGYGGHRRQSTFLCTHLASHGYVVAAMEHTGNTMLEVVQGVMTLRSGGTLPHPDTVLREFVVLRPADVSFVIDHILGTDGLVDADRIGMAGHSFGGWTTLTTTARDRRIRAAVHLDAHLRGERAAARLLAGDVRAALAERGVAASVV